MAIDQEIQRKVDAYRGNPQQLMQRYQQNQELIDLLALQKLKSEKEAAAREMQMQMAQQPETIKQQREAELLGMTKQEMMQQTQGVLQQRQAQQQQNMQQVAQQGLGALANQGPQMGQPAPQGQPMPRMAQGGIVAFQPGGSVGGVTYQEWSRMSRAERRRAGLPESFIGGQDYFNRFGVGMGLNDPETGERIRREPSPGSRGRRGQAQPPTEPIETAEPIERLVDQGRDPQQSPLDMFGGQPPAVRPPAAPQQSPLEMFGGQPPISRGEGLAGIQGEQSIDGGDTGETGETGETGGGGATGLASLGVGLGGGGADAAMQRGFQVADQYTGRAEKAGRYADMESEMRALDEELYDPREERRDQLKAFLAGTANTTNFGSTMAGGTLASLNMREKQKSERRKRLKDIFDMAERGMTLDSTLAEGGLRLGQTMYSEAMANQRTALSAAATLRSTELDAELRRAQLDYNKLKDDRDFGLRARELDVQEARNEATQAMSAAENDTRRFAAVSSALDRIQDQEAAVRKFALEASQLPALQSRLEFTRDPDERASLEQAIAREEAIVAVRSEQIFDQMGGVEARDLLAAELLSFTGTGAAMLSLEDVAGIERVD
jgi:hypothetical protein